ncbi:hypothetical protein [Bacillus sp. Marseille-P3661]|nr:hypothetical protein [Bacillus sp. Marseille-P3661]
MKKKLVKGVEKLLQDRINKILQNKEIENYDKLPGLVESLKLIKDNAKE